MKGFIILFDDEISEDSFYQIEEIIKAIRKMEQGEKITIRRIH